MMADREIEPNRRGVDRRRVLKKGLILFNEGRSSIGCHIQDISETGAKLVPVDVFSCPSEFLLKFTGRRTPRMRGHVAPRGSSGSSIRRSTHGADVR